jgi:hypothetical protein
VKEMIKAYGPPGSMPKSKGKEKLKKVEYIVTLVDVLRTKFANDYEKVAKFIQDSATTKNKGFGAK